MTTVGGRVVATFSREARANRRASDLAYRDGVSMWVHRRGPQADRLIAGGPKPGSGYREFPPEAAGSRTS